MHSFPTICHLTSSFTQNTLTHTETPITTTNKQHHENVDHKNKKNPNWFQEIILKIDTSQTSFNPILKTEQQQTNAKNKGMHS